jgi:predicted nucleic-acid-binding Zn-ribbon protein
MKELKSHTYKVCPECKEAHYHQMEVLTDMEKIITKQLFNYTLRFTCHGCKAEYIETHKADEEMR